MKTVDPHAPPAGSYRLKQVYAFVPLVVAAFAFGIFASYSASPNQACRAGNFGDALNATLTMLRGGSVCSSGASGQLKLAQDLLPLLLYLGGLYAGVKLIIAGVRHDAKVVMVRRLRGHTVVCGLGETGLEAIRQLAEKQGKIAAICLDAGEPGAKVCERLGVAVIAGDATLARTLGAAGIAQARAVVMCTGSDALNMEICLSIDAARRNLGHELKLFPEVRGSWLLETLGFGHAPVVGGRLELHPFRANQIIARTLLRNPLFLRNGPRAPAAVRRVRRPGTGDFAGRRAVQLRLSGHAGSRGRV